MLTVLKIAWRSIWRNKRRTLISMSAVGIGLALVILYTGVMAGVLGEAKEQLDNVGMGHVEVTATGWRTHRGATQSIAKPDQFLKSLNLPKGSETGYRVIARGLISSASGSEGVELHGVDWDQEKLLSRHIREVQQGELPKNGDARGILIGEKLADRLKVKVGGKVRLMVQRADSEIGAELYRVKGIFHSLSPAISQRKVYVSVAAGQDLLGIGNEAHQLVIQLETASAADQVAGALQQSVGSAYESRSYGDLLPMLRGIENLADSVVWFAAIFVYGLVGLGILNTMLMSVMERTREFGVLRAVGTRPGRIVGQVLGESFWIATLSVGIGLCLGLLITWYGSTHPLMNFAGEGGGEALEYAGTVIESGARTKFSLVNALKAAGLVYVMALATAIYPAWRVARMNPALALHSN